MSTRPSDTTALLDQIIRDLQRLAPSWQRPVVSHQSKSELIDKLRTMLCHPLVTRQSCGSFRRHRRDRHSRQHRR